jgi:preprotein translocase subunit SecA
MENLERLWDSITDFFGGLMRGFERFVTNLFGSSNARYIKKLQAKVDAINSLEAHYEAMSDNQLAEQTGIFKQRLQNGETLDEILVEAFAVCREAGKRFLGMRHYDVQLIGGMVLHSGAVAEMVTGEGKTLVATLPAYLNALEENGVHVVTVNDYLARRDMEWMGPLYMGLGLTVGAIQSNMKAAERQVAYACDITYGTNNEFGFDYLRDNMRPAARGDERFPKRYQQSQGKLAFAIIDEVDNILIDEARTPLIISGPAHADIGKYIEADKIARALKRDQHYTVNEKDHHVTLTDEGVRAAEKMAGVESFYTAGNMDWPHMIDNALKAHNLYKIDVNYVIKDGAIVIVDEFTGRLMEGRQWSDGLHQAVEAKEGVKIKEETQTLATITLQNYFKLYTKICGMTGTAMTEAGEFWKIYKLDVIAIPTNRKMQRLEHPDIIYSSEKFKWKAIADEVENFHRHDMVVLSNGEIWVGKIKNESGDEVAIASNLDGSLQRFSRQKIVRIQYARRPVLVGTTTIEKSELLSGMLSRRGIKHEVLNAKNHKREAEIVAQAGRSGAVTIATNMAGRGTDIVLGGNPETMAWSRLQDKYPTRLDVPADEWETLVEQVDKEHDMSGDGKRVKELGGLHVIGTERHDARRIDLQLRGRCGRQGDPGSSRFYLSLNDDLMRIFAGPYVRRILEFGGFKDDVPIESRMVSRRLDAAQKKREEYNFEIRKSLLEYDEVMDEQRKRIYRFRQNILDGASCRDLVLDMIREQVELHLSTMLEPNFAIETYARFAGSRLMTNLEPRQFKNITTDEAARVAKDDAERMAETEVLGSIEENLPRNEPESDWNWEAVVKFANIRWQLDVRDRDLKKIGRDRLDEFLIEKARAAIQTVDLSQGAVILQPDYGLKTALAWVKAKFGLDIDLEEVKQFHNNDEILELVVSRASQRYDDKEAEYPVMAGLYQFVQPGAGSRIDREGLVQWASRRFNQQLSLDDLKNKQREEIRELLVTQSKSHQKVAQQVISNLHSQVAELSRRGAVPLRNGNGEAKYISDWFKQELDYDLSLKDVERLEKEALEQRLEAIVEDHYHPEMRRMERVVVLEIVDSAWKDHLLAMDYLRAAVGQRGMAQLDPKVEYKREGMRLFNDLWKSIGERVTDLIFRMEQMNEQFVSNTLVETSARHDAPEEMQPGDYASEQSEIADRQQGRSKIETIRNREIRVGRNEPCPCGSGRKYKACCLRKHES